ncbi:type II toxin-antitoxin system YafQ family toxin [Xenorhabdus japonica]|uniref:mRNA interferase YafQ n=1 Tax=Xenorhabdus japonica TaxID=53341 RepID=A0A1I5B1N1_9GAMM|nr:type II toxin-antitoxin system YafQ family toxin [Xenorhabdus japonica]SFN68607.1 mRNA interferase YafQ [Xenorhabdus japonica]
MLTIVYQSRFKKDAKKYANNKKAQGIILETLALLQTGQPLPSKYKEHRLIGNHIGYLECHGAPDLLLIY